MTEEIYVNITGFNNYQVSNHGNVKIIKNGRILKPSTNTHGYLQVVLTHDGDKSTKTIHRLVADEFIPNPDNKICTDHINGDRRNNNVNNLRRATPTENNQNKSVQSNNTSETAGVSLVKKSNKWRARINVNGENIYLGLFSDKGDAIRVRHEAEYLHFGEFMAIRN